MIRKTFLLVVFLGLGFSAFSQIAQSSVEMYTAQAKERIRNYYSILNLITGNKLENEEKSTIIYETINKMFESEQVYVTNDIDLTNTTQTDFKIKDCLENIRLFYSNSEVSFRIDSMKVSDVYKARDFYFIKVEVFREMAVSFNSQQKKNLKNLDYYVKFVPGLFDCQIYSIKNHEDNLGEFTKAKISAIILPIIKDSVIVEKIPAPKVPIPETVPKVDSLSVLNGFIKKQSRKQTFWGISTLLMAGAGGYFMYESNQKYKEYQNDMTSHAASLRETSESYNKIGAAVLGVAGLCALEFTIHSIKKGKANDKLRLYTGRNGITLSYKF